MRPATLIHYIEQDDEYMYFEVYVQNNDRYNPGYESVGTIYIGKVKGIDRDSSTSTKTGDEDE